MNRPYPPDLLDGALRRSAADAQARRALAWREIALMTAVFGWIAQDITFRGAAPRSGPGRH